MSKHKRDYWYPKCTVDGLAITSPDKEEKESERESKQETREESKHTERPKERKGLKECMGPKFGKNQTIPSQHQVSFDEQSITLHISFLQE